MKEQFVTYEIAEKLKLVGFDEDCFAGYQIQPYGINKGKYELFFKPSHTKSINVIPSVYGRYCHQNNHVTKAPIYQQVFDWFRNVHKIHCEIVITETGKWGGICRDISTLNTVPLPNPPIPKDIHCLGDLDTYEDAREKLVLFLVEKLRWDRN